MVESFTVFAGKARVVEGILLSVGGGHRSFSQRSQRERRKAAREKWKAGKREPTKEESGSTTKSLNRFAPPSTS